MTRPAPTLTRKQTKAFRDLVARKEQERLDNPDFAAPIRKQPRPNDPWLKKAASQPPDLLERKVKRYERALYQIAIQEEPVSSEMARAALTEFEKAKTP